MPVSRISCRYLGPRESVHIIRHIYGHIKLLVSLASQPYFSAYTHARTKVGGGREGKITSGRWRPGTPAMFL